ncbi:N-acetyltransferase [bacterium]|nr:N-acetyltransferase [bacterium]
MLVIRPERPADAGAIHAVVAAAFPTDAEAQLVKVLRDAGRLTISLVADDGGEVVGHVAFSPVTVDGVGGGLGLAPLAVIPERRGEGIGGRLVREGLEAARAAGAAFAVVLGESVYYSRFGFEPAARHGLTDEYGGGDAFQVVALGGVPGRGLVKYAPEFAAFG